jgi:hypothetical protein
MPQASRAQARYVISQVQYCAAIATPTHVCTVEFLLARKQRLKCPALFRLRLKPYMLFAGFAATKFFKNRSRIGSVRLN